VIDEVEALLKEKIGLDAESIGRRAIEHAINERLSASGMAGLSAYVQHLRGSAMEQQALVDAVVVPETWFFRGREALDAMADMALDRWRRTGAPQRVLSLPCSTGEEPYSMAMALLGAGLPPDMFHIDGIDVSTRAIAAARKAIYGRNSFRGQDLGFRDHYLEQLPSGFRPVERVRRSVHFALGNMMDPAGSLPSARYDFIFCRNVLIYLDPLTQDIVVATLSRMLAPDGTLFVGASEASLPLRQGFSSLRIPMAAAFHRNATAVTAVPLDVRPNKAPPRAVPRRLPAAARASATPALMVRPISAPVVLARVDPVTALDNVQCLADAGRITEALKLGLEWLADHGPSSRIFYLLGLLSDSSGDPQQAGTYYRKALYLDPNHAEALAHLALLRMKLGDKAGAGALHARLRRRTPAT
jgi:chemotaxis protein methyltransferase WspC